MTGRRAGIGLAAVLVVVGGACGGHTPRVTKPSRSATSLTTVPSALPCGGTATIPVAVRASTVAGLDLKPARYMVANVSLARSDATWARFDTLPAAGQEATYQGGSGLAHCDGTTWTVTDFGTAEVGCPGGAVAPPPPAVRADLGIDCP
jgi:hypothetical protein